MPLNRKARRAQTAQVERENRRLKKAVAALEAGMGAKPIRAAAPVAEPTKIEGALTVRGGVTILAAADGDKTRRFEIVAYTGVPLNQGAMGWGYQVVIDQDGWDVGDGVIPMLDNHGPSPYSDVSARGYVVGQSDSAKVINGELKLTGMFIEVNKAASDIIAMADKGFKWQASVGARSLAKDFIGEGSTVEVNGRSFDGPIYVSRKTQLREVSFVVIGDDPNTNVVVATGGRTLMAKQTFAAFCKAEGYDDMSAMDDKTKAKMKAAFEKKQKDDDDDDDDTSARVKLDLKARQELRDEFRTELRTEIRAEARAEAAAERKRIAAIDRICATDRGLQTEVQVDGKPVKVDIHTHAIEAGWDGDRTELEVRRCRRPDAAPLVYSTSTPQLSDAVIEAAVLHTGGCQLESNDFYFQRGNRGPERRVPEQMQRETQNEFKARYTDQVQQAAHTLFRRSGIGLHQILTLCARSMGYRGSDTINAGNLEEVLRHAFGKTGDIRAAIGGSTISIQNVLANVQNKFLLEGYLYVDMSIWEIAAQRPTKDFKPTKDINIFGDFVFKKLNADGQIVNASMTDEAFSLTVDTYARKLNLNRQIIINDDVSALTSVPKLLGIGSSDAINILAWTLFLSPGNAADGNAFYFARNAAVNALGGGAAQSNLVPSGASSVLSSASLQTAVQLFDKQVKPNGQPLGVPPEILLYPPELDVTAWELMNSQFLIMSGIGNTAAKQPSENKWKGRFKPVKCPYLSNSSFTGNSATAWYLLASPQRMPVIQLGFLNGQTTPTVQTAQADFDELGIMIRGFIDPGATMYNFRGGVKSPGA